MIATFSWILLPCAFSKDFFCAQIPHYFVQFDLVLYPLLLVGVVASLALMFPVLICE